MISRVSIFLALAIFVATAGTATAQSTVKLSGSTTVASVMNGHKAEIEKASGARLDIIGNGSGRGLADVVAGQSDVAMLSSPLAEVAKKAHQEPAGLKEFKIAETKIVFIVHPSNPVKSLTVAQLKDIFAGKITNWKEVGGPDASIVPVTDVVGTGTRTTFDDQVMAGTPAASHVRAVANGAQIPVVVKQLPTAIGTSNPKQDLSSVKVIDTDKAIAQPLILVTKGEPNPTVAKLIDAAKQASR